MTTNPEPETQITTNAVTSGTLTGSARQHGGLQFTVGIRERLAMCEIFASCSGPIPFMTWVGLYANPLPGNPNSTYVAWFWLTGSQSSLLTDVRFGSGYRVAVVVLTGSQNDYSNNTYAYAVWTDPT